MVERRQAPFSNVEDTDWGRAQERRHNENQQRFITIERQLKGIDEHIALDIRADEANKKQTEQFRRENAERMTSLAAKVGTVEEENIKLRRALQENTVITESIKRDTASIIVLTQSLNVLRKFLTWAIPIGTSILAAYVTWTFKKG